MQRCRRIAIPWITAAVIMVAVTVGADGCTDGSPRAKGVYMLIDTAVSYAKELNQSKTVVNYLLGNLEPGDTLAVGIIDTGDFSEKDIITRVKFDARPSRANHQKRVIKKTVEDVVKKLKPSNRTDISGGVLQAVEYLNQSKVRKKYILIFSDKPEETAKRKVKDIPFQLDGFNVIVLNFTKLEAAAPPVSKENPNSASQQLKTAKVNGDWLVINDMARLDAIFDH